MFIIFSLKYIIDCIFVFIYSFLNKHVYFNKSKHPKNKIMVNRDMYPFYILIKNSILLIIDMLLIYLMYKDLLYLI